MAVSSTSDRKKRKKWYAVVATKDFQEMRLGETLAAAPEELLGRHLHLNLMTLLNDPKKQSITVHFRVQEVKGDTGIASLVRYNLHTSYLKRLIRKTSNKMEESYALVTKDGQRCRIKPILFTRYRVNNSTLTTLRKKAEEHLRHLFQQHTLAELFFLVISNKLQMDLKGALKTIYPVASCEIKAFYTEQTSPVPSASVAPAVAAVEPQAI